MKVRMLSLLLAGGTTTTCPEDFDGDCAVGITDLLTLLENWGRNP